MEKNENILSLKTCRICNETKQISEFGSNGLGGLRTECKKCRNEMKRESYSKNIDHERARRRQYREENKERLSEYKKGYRSKNPEKIKTSAHNTYERHKEQILKKQHEKYIRNTDYYLNIMKKMRLDGKLILVDRKHRSKQRGLGFEPINDYFNGSEFHHLTKKYGIFLPKKLHRSVYHSHITNKGIVEINDIALTWYKFQILSE